MPAPRRRVAVDALPGGQEARQRALVDGLDLLAQHRQRGAAQAPQHLGVAPLALAAAGAQLAADQLAAALERRQHGAAVDAVARPQLVRGERAVRRGVAADEPRQRVGHVLEERRRQPAGRHRAERVAVQAGVGGVDPALLAGEPDPDRAALALQLLEHRRPRRARRRTRSGASAAVRSPTPRSTSCKPSRAVARRIAEQELEVVLDLLERARVDQVAQLLLAEQLAQQVAVERQRRRAPLGVRRVALVHVRRDVVEQQRGGERRRGRRLDLDQRELAAVQRGQQLDQAGHVEHVAQALAVGLEHDRELAVLLGHLEQRLRLQPLLPQRRALARSRARDQQRAGGVLAEARAEQRDSRRARRRRRPRPRRARASRARRPAAPRRRGGGR